MQPLKFGNGKVILYRTFLNMWLGIELLGIISLHFSKKTAPVVNHLKTQNACSETIYWWPVIAYRSSACMVQWTLIEYCKCMAQCFRDEAPIATYWSPIYGFTAGVLSTVGIYTAVWTKTTRTRAFGENSNFEILQKTLHLTHFLRLLGKK